MSPCSRWGARGPASGGHRDTSASRCAGRVGDDEDVAGSSELYQPVAGCVQARGVGRQHVVGASDVDGDAFLERCRRRGGRLTAPAIWPGRSIGAQIESGMPQAAITVSARLPESS